MWGGGGGGGGGGRWGGGVAALVEQEVLEVGEVADDARRVVRDGAHHSGAIGALEVRLHHLVVLAVGERHRSDRRALQPATAANAPRIHTPATLAPAL